MEVYDLGHGNCTYDFFEQCPHRIARQVRVLHAQAVFRRPLLEGKTNLLRLLQEIPLREAEQAAVEDGVAAYKSSSTTCDVATLGGTTQRELGTEFGADHHDQTFAVS